VLIGFLKIVNKTNTIRNICMKQANQLLVIFALLIFVLVGCRFQNIESDLLGDDYYSQKEKLLLMCGKTVAITNIVSADYDQELNSIIVKNIDDQICRDVHNNPSLYFINAESNHLLFYPEAYIYFLLDSSQYKVVVEWSLTDGAEGDEYEDYMYIIFDSVNSTHGKVYIERTYYRNKVKYYNYTDEYDCDIEITEQE